MMKRSRPYGRLRLKTKSAAYAAVFVFKLLIGNPSSYKEDGLFIIYLYLNNT